MVDFSQYLKNKTQKTQQLVDAMTKTASGAREDDGRFWKPTLDKEKGVGGAIIRFLPVVDGSTLDYVDFTQYAFKWEDTGQWLIEKSLYKLGQSDPVYELRQRLYATKQEMDKKLAEVMRLNKVFIANIQVIKDPSHPENNGKVFLYRYNTTIQKLIDTALRPEPDPLTGEVAPSMNAFDLMEGANLEIRVESTQNGWSYTKTTWAKPTAIIEDQDGFERITQQLNSLTEFVDPSTFKTYDQINARLALVIGKDYIGSGVPVLTKPVEGAKKASEQAPVKAETSPSRFESSSDTEPPFEPDTKPSAVSDDSEDEDAKFKALMASM